MLEGELDVKLSAYNKLASGFEANYKLRDGSSAAAEQVRVVGAGAGGRSVNFEQVMAAQGRERVQLTLRPFSPAVAAQLISSNAVDIDVLLTTPARRPLPPLHSCLNPRQ